MIKYVCLFLLFIISYEAFPETTTSFATASTSYIYLPMKKDHKFGDDICYYREYDEKLHYYIYYVKPCESGKFCQNEISSDQPFGYCIDLLTDSSTISTFKQSCESDVDCQTGTVCQNSECTKNCPNQTPYQYLKASFSCRSNSVNIDASVCEKYEYNYNDDGYPTDINTVTPDYGNYPGLPNECGLIKYKLVNYKKNNPATSRIESDELYVLDKKEYCTIGSVPDNEFVTDEKFCYSGFSLKFYPNKLYTNPSKLSSSTQNVGNLCVTPISIDLKNELANDGCIITYKISDGSPKQYNLNLGTSRTCNKKVVIESERYRDFIDAFKESNEEDKVNCHDIDIYPNHCKNSKLIKLWYFYKHPEDYLFYKDRDKLKTVLDFKIQREYNTYAFTHYLNYSCFIFLLFLIIM